MFIKNALAAALTLSLLSAAQAGTVISAASATVLGDDDGSGLIEDTYALYGLLTDYVSGVTDWATYFASNPLHETPFAGGEWFATRYTSTAAVSYDLGSVQSIAGLALWNEDAAGIGSLNILGSTDGSNWTTLLSNLTPTDNPLGTQYGADLFNWSATNLRYVKLEMSGCPQPSGSGYESCSIGEVAFHAASPVPEASTLAMGSLGLALMGVAVARRRKQA
ncbi:MAG: discoidin domain-containing protein [Burkholderiales bacterium]|nr:discoidin domain-containing protein [Burkholderiales bacterium]MBH2016236.1 discoidin domain-containing protein [Burkholderiales bacterium]